MVVTKNDLEGVEWIVIFQNGFEWRVLVNILMNFLVP
jgi:hypothetical protein